MFNSNNGTQLTMPVQPAYGNGFGDGNGGGWWFWIIILIILFGGYGAYGYGGVGGATREATSVYEGYVLNNDMSVLNKAVTDAYSMTERKLDGINNGLCDGFYTQAQLINGLDKSIANSNYAIQNGMTQNRIAAMQDNNAITAQLTGLGTQLASCCCDLRFDTASKFADLNYNIATQDCATRQTVNDVGRNLADTQNANTRAILDKLGQMEANAKDDKIAELTAQINALQLAASQQAQNAYLIDQLGYKAPVAAFAVPAPWQYGNCGCNTGCGC